MDPDAARPSTDSGWVGVVRPSAVPSPSQPSTQARVRAFDWLRGLAVLVMVETHAMVLLRKELLATRVAGVLDYVNGLVAPSFIFAAGFSLALVQVRAASVGELRRFVQKFGLAALVDREGKRFAELGLRSAALWDERWLERLVEEPLLLRTPLVRSQQKLTIGPAEDSWREWLGK